MLMYIGVCIHLKKKDTERWREILMSRKMNTHKRGKKQLQQQYRITKIKRG
jgi:hypothetical protein